MCRFLAHVSWGLSLFYVIPLAGYVLLRGVPSDSPWWLDLANSFTLYLFIPAIPVLFLGLLSASLRMLLVSTLPIILFVFLYGGLLLPKLQSSTTSGFVFTVLTHNLNAGSADPEKVEQVIGETNADIVALQELSFDMADALTTRLGNEYPYQALLPRAGYIGVGVFSRFPIQSEESFSIGHLGQHLILDINGQTIHLFNFHPMPPELQVIERQTFPRYMIRSFDTTSQMKEMAAIMEKIDEVEGPMVAVGDFNMTDQSRQYYPIANKLTDTYREVGWGFGHTFPVNYSILQLTVPILRIDYIFHSRELKGLDAHVGESTGSDHLPLAATLRLQKGVR